MLDKIIHKHLDEMDTISDEVHKAVDKLVDSIDIKELMNDPTLYLNDLVDELQEQLIRKYFERVIKEGVSFSKAVAKAKEIIVPDTTDGTLNAELVGADDRHQD